MANLVTLSRLLLLLVVVWLFYQPITVWSFATFFLIVFIFISDGLDGYIARKRNETSLFGALFDIAGDRITELTLWIVAADVDSRGREPADAWSQRDVAPIEDPAVIAEQADLRLVHVEALDRNRAVEVAEQGIRAAAVAKLERELLARRERSIERDVEQAVRKRRFESTAVRGRDDRDRWREAPSRG